MARSSRRDSNKESFWRNTIDGHARSGLSVREWCRRNTFTEASFYSWRRELAQRDTPRIGPMFVPLRSIANTPGSADTPGSANTPTTAARSSGNTTRAPDERPVGRIEILLPGPRRVRLIGPVDRMALADVLAVLAGDSCADQPRAGRRTRDDGRSPTNNDRSATDNGHSPTGGNARRAEARAC
ncbi:MAG: IS66 family insertion sequence element accessory protein TnpA [Phycisphaerae bacterium]